LKLFFGKDENFTTAFLSRPKGAQILTEAKFRESKLHDIAHLGVRVTIGVIFIVQGSGKFDPGVAGWLTSIGLPVELQIPIALAETIGGILLIVGVLSRISSSILSIIMLGAIFHVKGASNLVGEGGFALDLMLLAGNLLIIVVGPGRASISNIAKKIPRFLH
jgi:putative oxidoreductase